MYVMPDEKRNQEITKLNDRIDELTIALDKAMDDRKWREATKLENQICSLACDRDELVHDVA
jgi:hypothetical protein